MKQAIPKVGILTKIRRAEAQIESNRVIREDKQRWYERRRKIAT